MRVCCEIICKPPAGTCGAADARGRLALAFFVSLRSENPDSSTSSGQALHPTNQDLFVGTPVLGTQSLLDGQTWARLIVITMGLASIPGPQKRGTGGTLNMVWKGHRDQGHPPQGRLFTPRNKTRPWGPWLWGTQPFSGGQAWATRPFRNRLILTISDWLSRRSHCQMTRAFQPISARASRFLISRSLFFLSFVDQKS